MWSLTQEAFEDELDFRTVIFEVLFMLVMVDPEIVSTLREVVLHGAVDLQWEQIAALSVFMVALELLLRLRRSEPTLRRGICRN